MEVKSLILGIVFSIGIFALKCGVGLHYHLARTPSAGRRGAVLAGFAGVYLLVFLAAGEVLLRFELQAHLAALQAFLTSGMAIHLALAGLMAFWGLGLLRRRRDAAGEASRGWLLLVVPCPVCATVIFLSLAFLAAGFPEASPMGTVLGLYAGFLAIGLATAGVMAAVRRRHRGMPPEALLGAAMLLIAAYFLLSVTVIPQFADLDEIYRLARNASGGPFPAGLTTVVLAAVIAAVFAAGFVWKRTLIRRTP